MDVRKLKAAMVARGVGVDELARETGLSRALVYRRLAKPDDFSIGEVRRVLHEPFLQERRRRENHSRTTPDP